MDEGFAPGIGEKLSAYVYLLVDPRTGRAFFVGRGRNDRCFRHVQAARTNDQAARTNESGDPGELGDPGPAAVTRETAVPGVKVGPGVMAGPGEYVAPEAESKPSPAEPGERTFPVLERIREIESSGRSVRIDILRYGLSADEARLVEAVAQDALGLRSASGDRGGGTALAAGAAAGTKDKRAGKSSGARRSVPAQRTEATRLNTLLAKPAKIKRSHRAVLLRLGKSIGPGASDAQVDEAMRSAWKIGRRWTDPESRRSPQWAFAVVDDVVRAVFRIDAWKPSDSTSGAADATPPARGVGPAAWTRPSQQAASPGQTAGASPGQTAGASPGQTAGASPGQTAPTRPPARWTLTGKRDPELEQKYRGRNVSAYLSSGSQNPVTYVWCGPHWVNNPV